MADVVFSCPAFPLLFFGADTGCLLFIKMLNTAIKREQEDNLVV